MNLLRVLHNEAKQARHGAIMKQRHAAALFKKGADPVLVQRAYAGARIATDKALDRDARVRVYRADLEKVTLTHAYLKLERAMPLSKATRWMIRCLTGLPVDRGEVLFSPTVYDQFSGENIDNTEEAWEISEAITAMHLWTKLPKMLKHGWDHEHLRVVRKYKRRSETTEDPCP